MVAHAASLPLKGYPQLPLQGKGKTPPPAGISPVLFPRHPGPHKAEKPPGIPCPNIFYLYVENRSAGRPSHGPPKAGKGRFFPEATAPAGKKTRLSRAMRSPPPSAMRAEAQGFLFRMPEHPFPIFSRSRTKKARVFRRFWPCGATVQAPGGLSCPEHGAPRRPVFPQKSAFSRCTAVPALRKAGNPHSGRFYFSVRQGPGISSLFSAFSPYCYIFV